MFSAELKKGSIEMLVLSLLESRARHGYEIGKLIDARSSGRLTFALPTLYPTLLRLESRGWIKGRWVEKAGARERCFYRLTPEERRVLAEQRQLAPLPSGSRPGTRVAHRPRAGGAARGLLSRRARARGERSGRGRAG